MNRMENIGRSGHGLGNPGLRPQFYDLFFAALWSECRNNRIIPRATKGPPKMSPRMGPSSQRSMLPNKAINTPQTRKTSPVNSARPPHSGQNLSKGIPDGRAGARSLTRLPQCAQKANIMDSSQIFALKSLEIKPAIPQFHQGHKRS